MHCIFFFNYCVPFGSLHNYLTHTSYNLQVHLPAAQMRGAQVLKS